MLGSQRAAIPVAVVLPAIFFVREVYRRSARMAVRSWLLSKAPIFTTMEEVVTGGTTLRAFALLPAFIDTFYARLETNMRWVFTRDTCNLWGDIRFGFCGADEISIGGSGRSQSGSTLAGCQRFGRCVGIAFAAIDRSSRASILSSSTRSGGREPTL